MKIKPQCDHKEQGRRCLASAGWYRLMGGNRLSKHIFCRKHRNPSPGDPGAYVSLRIARLRLGSAL